MWTAENHSVRCFDVAVSIVACRHSPEEIANLLRSLAQTRLSIQITLVDNSENSHPRLTAEAYGVKYVHVLQNVGFGAGHNLAIPAPLAYAKYQAISNPDISFESNVLYGAMFRCRTGNARRIQRRRKRTTFGKASPDTV
jgi:GT2 family glycosyltransferase